jgi:hypothetical protein
MQATDQRSATVRRVATRTVCGARFCRRIVCAFAGDDAPSLGDLWDGTSFAHTMGMSTETGTGKGSDAATELRQLRDRIRVKLHLLGMDLRDKFEELDREADKLLAQAPAVEEQTLDALAKKLRQLADKLHKPQTS